MYRLILFIFLLSGIIAGCKKHDTQGTSSVVSTPHNWQKINSPVSGYNSDIYFTSKDTGYIFGSSVNCYVLQTTDGGNTWNILTSFSSDYPVFNCFYPLTTKTLFVVRDTLYRSSDGGTTWANANSWNGTTAYQFAFTDSQTGFILTNDKIYSTADGGNTWHLAVTLNGSFTTLVFPDKLHGFASGGADIEENGTVNVASVGVLSATVDGGHTWTKLDTGSWMNNSQRFKRITAIDFSGPNDGLMAMDNNTLSFTTDGGLHWEGQNKNLPGIITQIKYDKSGKVFFIAANHVYSSDNNGLNIGLEFSGIDEFLKIAVTADNQIFLIGRSGQIYKRM